MQDTWLSVIAYGAEFLIAWFFFQQVFREKRPRYAVLAVSLTGYIICALAFLFLSNIVVNVCLFTIVNFLIVFGFFDSSWRSSLLSSLFLSGAMLSTEFAVMSLLSIGTRKDIAVYHETSFMFFLMVVLSKTAYWFVTKAAIVSGLYFQKKTDRHMPAFLLIYPVCAMLILYTFYIIAGRYPISREIEIALFISSIAIVLSVFLTFVFYGRTSKKLEELYNAQREAVRVQSDKTYYALLDRQNETLKQISHDEKNHLATIKSLANTPEVDAYIDSIYRDIQYHSMFGNTQNRYLDLLLNKYQSVCDEKGINLSYSIKTANLSFMEAPYLITLVSNILDNAVDAAGQCAEKWIDLSINRANGFDILSCSNSCDVKPISNGKTLSSTKKEKGFHGFGMKSIKRIAEKYHGEIDWFYRENKKGFVINIAFFMED